MLIVGLTGGIASGKSTASQYFESLGTPVIDADIISRQLVQPGQAALQEIIARFGSDLLSHDGQLDRPALRTLVFSDSIARQDLEGILHPLIQAEMRRQIKWLNSAYCILAIPLLVETGPSDLVEHILLIDTDEALQYQRLHQRDGLDDETIKAIINAQASHSQRRAVADDIVTNNGNLTELQAQLQRCHQNYLRLGQR